MSSEERFAAALEEFKLGDEDKRLILQFAITEIKEEVDSDAEHHLKKNVDAPEVKEEVESDVEADDGRATEEPLPVVEQEVQSVLAETALGEAQLQPEEPEFFDVSTILQPPLHHDDADYDVIHAKDLQMGDETAVMDHSERKDDEMEDDENMEESDEEELTEEQDHEEKEYGEEIHELPDENNDGGDMDEGENTDDEYDKPKVDVLKKRREQPSAAPVGRRLFTCLVKNCPSSFNAFKNLEEHMKIHPGKQDFLCDVCKKDFSYKGDAMTHIQEREKKECCGCGKKFSKCAHLVQHLRSHSGEKPFVCKTCGQRFSMSTNLKNHMLTHTGEKKFSCGFCKKSFTQKSHLKIHERIHTGEKPFKCEHCDFKCSHPFSLSVHTRIHTDDKPYSCGHCEKRFSLKENLKRHERTHTGEKPFKCSYCGHRWNDRSDMNKHIRMHTGQKPYACKKCDTKFSRGDVLKKHAKRMHPS